MLLRVTAPLNKTAVDSDIRFDNPCGSSRAHNPGRTTPKPQAIVFSQITLFLESFLSTFPCEAVGSDLKALVINAMIIRDL